MATSDLAGRRVAGRYTLEQPISAGGMATVWRARDEVLGREVAMKVLRDELATDDELLERFRLEAVASARLGHPAVVRVFDTGVDAGVCYIVMELFPGETLSSLLERRGPLPSHLATAIAQGALAGLAHAHAEGIVHRDVKPSNILVGEDGSVKVTDFGIAKAAFADGDLTTTGSLLGTAKYLAPEQVQGSGVDARSDLYALGVVLYEMLTGRPPFNAETHIATATMRLTNDPPPPRSLRPDISPTLEAVVMKALARDPDDRFQTAEEMSAALARVSETAPSPRAERRPRQRREPAAPSASVFRSWIYVPIVLVILAGLVVAGYVLVRELGRGNGNRGARDAVQAEPLDIEAALIHDPKPGDGFENDEAVPLAFDGDPDTYWETEGYDGADLGGIKPGVGLILDLGRPEEVGSLRLRTPLPGWRFELMAGETADAFGDALPSSEGETSFRAHPATSIELEPVTARYLLIWITELAADDRYRASVAEVDVYSSRG